MKITKLRAFRDAILGLNWPPLIKKLLRQWLSVSFLKYVVVGLSAFLFQITLLFVLTAIIKLDKITANIIAAAPTAPPG